MPLNAEYNFLFIYVNYSMVILYIMGHANTFTDLLTHSNLHIQQVFVFLEQ